ncbi:rhodanese-like domain-containing protein [Halotalea alkalilenta]|uniref:rhodanese-like domain-containing protein n=1 Tax=Halotalea alkalilenta TaxID=376489 RepID=UPI0006947FED|nr:rhodanese-like domain-containing protein [Halotalea alkalilenta]
MSDALLGKAPSSTDRADAVGVALLDFASGVERIKRRLIEGEEIALLDVREEAEHATGHPLFASHLALSNLELHVYARLPRREVPIVTFDAGGDDDRAVRAAIRLRALGYSDVTVFEQGVAGWVAGGGEPFIDVNAPSKAFGELVESERHTPSLSADELKALIESDTPPVILDARRFEEYQNMSIPTGISVPGAELALRVAALAPDPATRVVVNCAGRTRSIIGTQSLINVGIPNRVEALRNGTIGWTLAGHALEHGQTRSYTDTAAAPELRAKARRLADRAGVRRADERTLSLFRADTARTTYYLDVRSPQEFLAGHLPGFLSAPGGQLVQETEAVASVRGARIVLSDDDGVRANLTGHWLAQMNWEVWVHDQVEPQRLTAQGAKPSLPAHREVPLVTPRQLAQWLEDGEPVGVFDLTSSANYVAGHIPGAAYVQRAELARLLGADRPERVVLTCGSSLLAGYAAAELLDLGFDDVAVLDGGNQAWRSEGLPLESGETRLLSARRDRYRRPYEGHDNPREAMEAYLEWEFGLVEQLERDGTHGFKVLGPA